jgi:RHS repeat-associated protein
LWVQSSSPWPALLLIPANALSQSSSEVIEYYHLDALGSVRVVADQTGAVLRRHDFKPFGEEINVTFPNPDRKLFTGQERDSETGLDFFGARYYRVKTGTFLTTDPLGSVFAGDFYAYAGGNPLRYVDLDGRQKVAPFRSETVCDK